MKLSQYIAGVANAISGKPVALSRDELIGWTNTTIGTYAASKSNDFENAYPSITRIMNKFMMIRPYAIDGDGDSITTPTAVINALYHPNTLNSGVEFREALALMYLVHAKTHILVWRKEGGRAVPGGKITPNNIAGFTFMENVQTITVAGKTTYTVTNDTGTATYNDSEVITLRGLNPYAINTGGYSATQAAHKWATIDDYIASYQKGFFENGAVPSGRFNIIAPSIAEFRDMAEKLKRSHKGAGANNNIDYVHVPLDPSTGKPVQAQVEWIPYSVSNRELSLQDLFTQANQKIDSVYGVPASIRGVGENNNYATARTDQQNFMENVVDPIALKIWSGITHELNRITGGLGVGISYDVVIPALADEELVQAQTGKTTDERVQLWLAQGYSLSSIKAYLDSGDLEALEKVEVAEVVEDNPDVDDGDEVDDAPKVEAATRINPKAEVDAEFLKLEAKLKPYENQITDILTKNMKAQVDNALADVSMIDVPSDEDMADELLAVIAAIVAVRGLETHQDGIRMVMEAGGDTDDIQAYIERLPDGEKARALEIIESYNGQTTADIKKLVKNSTDNTALVAALAGYIATQDWRVERFASNESWRASEYAANDAMTQIQDGLKKNTTMIATWIAEPNACPLCSPLRGLKEPVGELFEGGWSEPPIHVACRCRLSYSAEVTFEPNNIAGKNPNGIYAPNGRFIGERLGKTHMKLINPTSKEEVIVKL